MISKFNLAFYILISGISLHVSGCDEPEINGVEQLNGKMTGYFIRSSPTTRYRPISVSFNFTDNTFEGTSELDHFPAICNGTYLLGDNSIELSNSCVWTADFDWTLILQGKWLIYEQDGKIIISRDHGNGLMDRYELQPNKE